MVRKLQFFFQLDDKSLKTVLVGAEHRKLPLQPGITVKQLALSAACFPDNSTLFLYTINLIFSIWLLSVFKCFWRNLKWFWRFKNGYFIVDDKLLDSLVYEDRIEHKESLLVH